MGKMATRLMGGEFRVGDPLRIFTLLHSGTGAVFDQRPHVQQGKWQEYISCV